MPGGSRGHCFSVCHLLGLPQSWFGKPRPATWPCWSPRMSPCFPGTPSASLKAASTSGGSCMTAACSCCCPSCCGTTRCVRAGSRVHVLVAACSLPYARARGHMSGGLLGSPARLRDSPWERAPVTFILRCWGLWLPWQMSLNYRGEPCLTQASDASMGTGGSLT